MTHTSEPSEPTVRVPDDRLSRHRRLGRQELARWTTTRLSACAWARQSNAVSSPPGRIGFERWRRSARPGAVLTCAWRTAGPESGRGRPRRPPTQDHHADWLRQHRHGRSGGEGRRRGLPPSPPTLTMARALLAPTLSGSAFSPASADRVPRQEHIQPSMACTTTSKGAPSQMHRGPCRGSGQRRARPGPGTVVTWGRHPRRRITARRENDWRGNPLPGREGACQTWDGRVP